MNAQHLGLLMADLALIIVCARLAGAAAVRIGQPAVIGEIIGGFLLGPTLLGTQLTGLLFPTDVRAALGTLADIGLVLFMFGVGYELDLRSARRPVAASIAAGSVLVPFALGTAVATWLATRHDPADPVSFALFMGIAMAVTAFPVLARIVVDRGLAGTHIGTLALAVAAIGDVVAWSVLAVIVALGGGQPPLMMLLCVPLVAIMMLVVRPLLAKALPRLGVPVAFTTLAAGLLLSAAATQLIGLHYVFGAFLFGAICPRTEPSWLRGEVVERLTTVGGRLLLPVFFVISGLGLDLGDLEVTDVGELAAILGVAVGGKVAGVFAAAVAHRMPPRDAGRLAVLLNARGLTEIVVLTIGLQVGLLDERLYSLMIIMALLTTVLTGPLLSLFGDREARPNAGARSAKPHEYQEESGVH